MPDQYGNPLPGEFNYIAPFSQGFGQMSVGGGSPMYSGNPGLMEKSPSFNIGDLFQIGSSGKNVNGTGFGWNVPTAMLGLQGISQLGQLYLGLQQLGLAKDSFKFQKDAYNKNLANQTSSYNTQMRDRVTGRNYATEEERQAALNAALLPTR